MYNNVYFKAGGQNVSSLVSYIPQASQIKNRLMLSGAWSDSIGKSAFMVNPSFNDRMKLTSAGAYDPVDSSTRIRVGLGNATIAIATTGVMTGNNTLFTTSGLVVADNVFVDGKVYTVDVIANATTMTVSPAPGTAVTATDNYVFYKPVPEYQKNTITVCWRPPAGISDYSEPMGSGDYRWSLSPSADYKKACVQSIIDKAITTNFNVSIDDVKFYACSVKMEYPDRVQEIALYEMELYSKVANKTNSLQFTVPPSTRFITIFVQSGLAGSDTRFPPSLFTTEEGEQNNLTNLQLVYANQVKPQTRYESNFGTATNKIQQRYIDNLIEMGKLDSIGGHESLGQFLERGCFYHYAFNKDESDRSTQVQLSVTFENLPGGNFTDTTTKLFLCAHFTTMSEITTSNGSIVSVRTLNV